MAMPLNRQQHPAVPEREQDRNVLFAKPRVVLAVEDLDAQSGAEEGEGRALRPSSA